MGPIACLWPEEKLWFQYARVILVYSFGRCVAAANPCRRSTRSARSTGFGRSAKRQLFSREQSMTKVLDHRTVDHGCRLVAGKCSGRERRTPPSRQARKSQIDHEHHQLAKDHQALEKDRQNTQQARQKTQAAWQKIRPTRPPATRPNCTRTSSSSGKTDGRPAGTR